MYILIHYEDFVVVGFHMNFSKGLLFVNSPSLFPFTLPHLVPQLHTFSSIIVL